MTILHYCKSESNTLYEFRQFRQADLNSQTGTFYGPVVTV